VTASELNTHLRDNFLAVYAGSMSLTSQAQYDLLQASSATQLARIAGAALGILGTDSSKVPAIKVATALQSWRVNEGGTDVEAYTPAMMVRKSAAESVTSSATPQDDDHLLVALVAGATYIVRAGLVVTGGMDDGGIRAQLNSAALTLTSAQIDICISVSTSIVARDRVSALASVVSIGDTNIASAGLVEITGALVVNVGGTLNIQWAQGSSSGVATTVGAGSYLIAQRVE